MKKITYLLSFLIIITLLFTALTFAKAGDGEDEVHNENSATEVSLTNPLPDGTTPQSLIGNIISALMGIVGSLALAMFIYGGFTWMTAAGNSERVSKGKDILIWATLGLVAIFASYSIIKFLIGNLG